MFNNLIRLFNIEQGKYGEPFALCDSCFRGYSVAGCHVERIGQTEMDCQCQKQQVSTGNSNNNSGETQ